mmetsp:Transcript_760/g.2742  ORF Transcript_760/g.2742 Transcript_760/m.2742 type:complete len:223 (+) Transcript_760:1175-1843(+)
MVVRVAVLRPVEVVPSAKKTAAAVLLGVLLRVARRCGRGYKEPKHAADGWAEPARLARPHRVEHFANRLREHCARHELGLLRERREHRRRELRRDAVESRQKSDRLRFRHWNGTVGGGGDGSHLLLALLLLLLDGDRHAEEGWLLRGFFRHLNIVAARERHQIVLDVQILEHELVARKAVQARRLAKQLVKLGSVRLGDQLETPNVRLESHLHLKRSHDASH